MKNIFLASSIAQTGPQIGRILNSDGKNLSLVFITTGSETDAGPKEWLENDRDGLVRGGFEITAYTITDKNLSEIQNDLSRFDVVHVNGGNSFYLLLQAVKSGFDQWILDAVDKGKIYIGSSAGAIVASTDITATGMLETEVFEKELGDFEKKGLGLVDVLPFPHWGSESFRDFYLSENLDRAYQPQNKIVLLNDYQYLRTSGTGFEFIDVRNTGC
jgi:dipeptidase E